MKTIFGFLVITPFTLSVSLLTSCGTAGFSNSLSQSIGPVQGANGAPTIPEAPLPASPEPAIPVIPSTPATGEIPTFALPPPVDVIFNTPAAVPVSIGGATLICNIDLNHHMLCEIQTNAGLSDLSPQKVYLVTNFGKTWTPITLEHTALGTYGMLLAASTPDVFAIAFQYNQTDFLSTIVGDPTLNTEFLSIVNDGEFDLIPRDSTEKFFSTLNADLIASASLWRVENAPGTVCAQGDQALLESQLPSLYTSKAAGSSPVFIELDSTCPSAAGDMGRNTILSQELNVEANHIYRLSYLSKKRMIDRDGSTLKRQGLTVRIDDEIVAEGETISESWVKTTFTFTPSAARAKISFEETGVSDGIGTLLDSVFIYDLGAPPAP